MPAYLTPQEAHDRLAAFEIDSLPSQGAVDTASRRVDNMGPFYGARYTSPQERAFPRTFTAEGDTEGEVPNAVLDWVALEAHQLTTTQSGGDKPPVSSVSHAGAGSVTYARPKVSNEVWLQYGLLKPYLRRSGTIN
jgi:hypothetical protein